MLCFVDDQTLPGITRKRSGRYWQYFDADGSRITDRDEIDRLNAVGMPPAYRDAGSARSRTAISRRPATTPGAASNIATIPISGRSRKPRNMSGSPPSARRCPSFARGSRRICRQARLSRDTVLAAVVRLIDNTRMRVGNEEYAKDNKSFGATTLRNRHAKVRGQLKISFMAKHGIKRELTLTDRNLVRIAKRPGPAGPESVRICRRGGRAAPVDLERRQRLYQGGDGRGVHRQGFPHLGRQHDRLRGDLRGGRAAASGSRRDRAGRRGARQHAGDQPQILCPSGADRGGQGRAKRSAAPCMPRATKYLERGARPDRFLDESGAEESAGKTRLS